MTEHKDIYAYDYYGDGTYINLTNRCSNVCTFCIRATKNGVGGHDLWLEKEPSVQDVLDQLKELSSSDEIVFCGYGEPTYRLKELIAIAKAVKAQGKRVRLDTNGQGNLINGRDITDELSECVDSISISLNAPDIDSYNELCNPNDKDNAYCSVIEFAKACVGKIEDVTLSVMELIGEEKIAKCQKIADDIGAKLRIRAYVGD